MAGGLRRREGEGAGLASEGCQPNLVCQRTLTLRNRQPIRHVDLRLVRQMVRALLRETWREGSYDLAFYFVAAPEMTRLNETFLQHGGSTDVITFDYAEKAVPASRLSSRRMAPVGAKARRDAGPPRLHGEIFVCLDEAVSQARQFRTTWQSELVRYVVHGVLHLLGHDDLAPRARQEMKRAEDALVGRLARQFDFRRLRRRPRPTRGKPAIG